MTWHYDLALIPCSKKKSPVGITPATLYKSAAFSLMLRHAQQRCKQVLIMSARHGLLRLQDRVAPYDAYLPDLTLEQRALLAVEVKAKLLEYEVISIPPDRVLSYLPLAYFEFLASIDIARDWAREIHRPYKSLGLLTGMKVLSDELHKFKTPDPASSGSQLSGIPRKRIAL